MENKLKKSNGITLVALAITIVVIAILATITINIGMDTVKRAKLENLKVNMLLLQGKLKGYVEDAKFEKKESVDNIGKKISAGSSIEEAAKSANISNATEWYYFTNAEFEEMGLKDVQKNEGEFIAKYDIENIIVDIVYTPGYVHTDGKTYYSLNEIEDLQ